MFEIEAEKYESVKLSLKELLEEIKAINEVTIFSKKYKIQFILGGDLKFIALIFGLQAANSNHPCPWCHFNIAHPVNTNANWPISRKHHLSREYTSQNMISDGYANEPLLDFIEFDCCVIDLLLLLLRISDQLFEALII